NRQSERSLEDLTRLEAQAVSETIEPRPLGADAERGVNGEAPVPKRIDHMVVVVAFRPFGPVAGDAKACTGLSHRLHRAAQAHFNGRSGCDPLPKRPRK